MIAAANRSFFRQHVIVIVVAHVVLALVLVAVLAQDTRSRAPDSPPRDLWFTVIVCAASFALVDLLAAAYIAGRFGRELRQLSEGAIHFAAGDLRFRVERPTIGELGRLSDSLNEMARQIQDRLVEIQAQRAEQRAILESMSSGVLALDPEQRLLVANRAAEAMLQFEGPAMRGRLLQEIVREPELHRFVRIAITQGSRTVGEFSLFQKGRLTVTAVSEPLVRADGSAAGVVVVLTDVTVLRKLESMRSDFAANVSHELRTPITSILGYLETLRDVGTEDAGAAAKWIDTAHRAATRLQAIVEDLLTLARLERPDSAEFDQTSRSAVEILDSVALNFAAAAQEKHIRIERTAEPALRVSGGQQLIEQAIGNLLSNAIRYSPGETIITLGARARPGGKIEIFVSDQGPGIAAEHLPRLFERFYRVDQARSRHLGGTGLGLAIVKHIAQVHGGSVEVESTVGKGTTFRLILPGGRG